MTLRLWTLLGAAIGAASVVLVGASPVSAVVFFQPSGSNSAWCLSWVRVNGPTGTSPLPRYNNSSLWFVSIGTQGRSLP